jgi:lipopolysaccharide export system ATP-binding protein
MALLEVHNLSVNIGKKTLLRNVSWSIDAGQRIAFLGPNGAGKTTLLRTIIGLLPTPPILANRHNTILFDGTPINNLPIAERITRGLIYLPQHSALFQKLSCWDNLNLVFEHHTAWQKKIRAEFMLQAEQWITQTGIGHVMHQSAGTLSGGQKRKLEIIRAVLMHPRVLLLDEPFAGVDPKSISELQQLFGAVASQGVGVLISDHHVAQLLRLAEFVYVLVAGEIVAQGTADEILADAYTKETYLGHDFV